MALNVAGMQIHQNIPNEYLNSTSLDTIPPKISNRSHPYLNIHLTLPPKPSHFYQLSNPIEYQNSQDLIKNNQEILRNNQNLNNQSFSENYDQNLIKDELNNDIQKENQYSNNYSICSENYQNQIYANQSNFCSDNSQLSSSNSGYSTNENFNDSQIINKNSLNVGQKKNYHGLPEKFVKALKKLFDVFNSNKTGLVRILDIEARINDEEFDEELDRPKDLIDSLRKVTSPNGLINFSNFCAGIKICLLKNQLAKSKQQTEYLRPINNEKYISSQKKNLSLENIVNQKNIQQTIYNNYPFDNSSFTSTNSGNSLNSSKIHKDSNKLSTKSNHNHSLNKLKYRPASVPVDFNEDDNAKYNDINQKTFNKKLDNKAKSMGNLKEQIYASKLRQCNSESKIQNSVISAQEIMERLYEWRNSILERKMKNLNIDKTNCNQQNILPTNKSIQNLYSTVNKKMIYHKKREVRRHTVNSLHDINIIKRLNFMQKEKELFQQGIIMVDRAKQWYSRHLSIIQNQIDSINHCSKTGNNFFFNQFNHDYNLEHHAEKINLLSSKIGQVNRNLVILMDDLLPQQTIQMTNFQPEIEIHKLNSIIFRLKEQNRILNEELLRKSSISFENNFNF